MLKYPSLKEPCAWVGVQKNECAEGAARAVSGEEAEAEVEEVLELVRSSDVFFGSIRIRKSRESPE
jgi:hypothetical protein